MNPRRSLLSLLTLLAALLLAATSAQASAPSLTELETAVGRSTPPTPTLVGSQPPRSPITPRLAAHRYDRNAMATGVAAKAGAGAENVANAVRLRAQLAGQEIAGGHAFGKHVIDEGQFPGVRTRAEFAEVIENVVAKGEMRSLSAGRTAYWRRGVVVIRNPRAPDGGTAFVPRDGRDYFLGLR